MNCANHSDLPVSAYCQNCGKPLCTQCVRSVAGVVYCEPCLAARLNPGAAYSGGATTSTSGGASRSGASVPPGAASSGSAAWGQVPVAGSRFGAGPSPVLAGLLGLIPGVGAMYNGQFVKAFAHVIVFVVLIGVAEHFGPGGILLAAWVFYQVFDAAQTAIARRDGTPLPDPFGLNDLGQRLGMPPAAVYTAPPAPPSSFAGAPAWAGQPVPGVAEEGSAAEPFASTGASPEWSAHAQSAGAAQAEAPPFAPGEYNPGAPLPQVPPAAPPFPLYAGRSEPIGAIVLIGVGMLFLLSTLGVFRLDWVGRGWPVLIILIGVGLLFSRVRATRRAGGGL